MRRLLLVVAVVGIVGFAGEGKAYDEKGDFFARGHDTCANYLDAYSRATLKGEGEYTGPPQAWGVFGWINGFISGVNWGRPGNVDYVAGMSYTDTYRWVASWCRDNSSSSVAYALFDLIDSRNPK